MPQMFRYCGQRFQVYKRAHKTCDTVSGQYVGLRLSHAVHLDLRCDGQAYGGCQAACLIFWKEAWLKRVGEEDTKLPSIANLLAKTGEAGCTESDVWRATKHGLPGAPIYSCQATELLHFTTPLKWWDARQYVEAYRSGNESLGELLRGFAYLFYYYVTLSNWHGLGRPGRWLYDRFQLIWGGVPFPRRAGQIPVGKPTPRCDLGLKPGDLVRVKPYQEILATLDTRNSNRGLSFDAELVPYCGKIYRVKTRVDKFIDEKTGKMRHLRTPAVMLEGVYLQIALLRPADVLPAQHPFLVAGNLARENLRGSRRAGSGVRRPGSALRRAESGVTLTGAYPCFSLPTPSELYQVIRSPRQDWGPSSCICVGGGDLGNGLMAPTLGAVSPSCCRSGKVLLKWRNSLECRVDRRRALCLSGEPLCRVRRKHLNRDATQGWLADCRLYQHARQPVGVHPVPPSGRDLPCAVPREL